MNAHEFVCKKCNHHFWSNVPLYTKMEDIIAQYPNCGSFDVVIKFNV